MLCAGDEIGKTQQGNNNPYCQDNSLSWLDWPRADAVLLAYVQSLITLRQQEPLLHNGHWFAAHNDHSRNALNRPRLKWLAPTGQEMQVDDWHQAHAHTFACQMLTAAGEPPTSLFIAFNPEFCAVPFTLPHPNPTVDTAWRVLLDSAGEVATGTTHRAGHALSVAAHSLLVLRAGA
jgi:glycogen operon protein